MRKDNKRNKDKDLNEKSHISDVRCSENENTIKLQLMGLYGEFGNEEFRFDVINM